MRPVTLEQHQQPDGSIYHMINSGCPMEPCVKAPKSGEIPEVCPHLHCGCNDNEELQWVRKF